MAADDHLTKAYLDEDIYESAASWLEHLSDGPLDKITKRRFVNWLKSNPQHQIVFERMLNTWSDPALTSAAANALRDASVLDKLQRARMYFQRPWYYGAALSACVLLTLILLLSDKTGSSGTGLKWELETPVAQSQHQALQDGSLIELSAASALDVQFNDQRRRVTLKQGAAYFTVAPDKTRPFEVHINNASVTAVGTQFNIDKTRSGIDVTVYEGAIEVRYSTTATPALLRSGERVRIDKSGLSPVTQINLAHLVDWRSGWIEIADESLGYLVDQLNRHSPVAIEIDPELSPLRVAGRFRLHDTREALALLCELYPVAMDQQAGRIFLHPSSG